MPTTKIVGQCFTHPKHSVDVSEDITRKGRKYWNMPTAWLFPPKPLPEGNLTEEWWTHWHCRCCYDTPFLLDADNFFFFPSFCGELKCRHSNSGTPEVHYFRSEIPSMGPAVEPGVFYSIHTVFSLDNQNYCRKYNRRKMGEILHWINAPVSLTATRN